MWPRNPCFIAVLTGSMLAVLGGCDQSEASPLPKSAADGSARDLVVVELFQSQGCSSCPPANADLNAIADRRDVLALSFAVTYWDRLGWKHTFASPLFTARQQDYARAGRGEVATPEFIVGGTEVVLGSNRSALEAAIGRASATAGRPAITASTSRVNIPAAARAAPSTLWLVRYDPRTRAVAIRAGENGGRTLPHRNIVRELVKLGNWTGLAATFPLVRPHEAGLAAAVLVQRGSGGPIIAAQKL